MSSKVSFKNVSKKYYLTKTKIDKLKSMISSRFDKDGFYAVRNVSFDVKEGETIGLVGINGSGKSTLSNMLAKIIPPTKGSLVMNGQPSLIAIAAGLNNALTGKDNIYLKCLMMGLSSKEIDELYDSIVEFADIGDFIDQPVKSYSSGMKSRLGFAISVHIEPDILIIDEALSVGDQTFYQKCVNKITDFKKQGKTIFFVSHSIGQIEKICDRVIWMHYGELRMFDETKVVVKEYKEFVHWYNGLSKKEKDEYNAKNKESRKHPIGHSHSGILENELTTRRTKKREKKSNPFIPVFVIFFLFMGITATMFSEKPLRTIASFGLIGANTAAPAESIAEEKTEKVSEKGYIIADEADVYAEEGMTERVGSLPFGTSILVTQMGDKQVYIEAAGISGHVSKEDIKLQAEPMEPAAVSMDELSGYLSSNAAVSYEYLLSFIDSDKATLLRVMNGIEEVEEQGIKKLYLAHENVYYVLDDEEKVEEIIFHDFNPITSGELSLADHQLIEAKDQSRFLFQTEKALITIHNDAGQLSYSSL
ncbi:teichoic acid ABC transporter ATP-binding protein [Bacillus sp. FJAT-27916]|uniref:ABC transporter ATP-binding protein n=1 Tax=Bacillus sp. FJAT-27916 TaxID=1679169 RepID=UPI000670AB49|nr:ABC transporter ATP-binding protein [Bacillus sp. FJAT-27916]KMY43026.1 teichoic acid ABC transporter ATP-binding protein [Bacillus sp. FJAT-27916]